MITWSRECGRIKLEVSKDADCRFDWVFVGTSAEECLEVLGLYTRWVAGTPSKAAERLADLRANDRCPECGGPCDCSTWGRGVSGSKKQ